VGADSGTALVIRDSSYYLDTVREVRVLAERIESIEDAKSLADRAAAAKVWAQRAKLGTDQVNLAAVARLWAERRAGELLATMRKLEGGRPSDKTPSQPRGVSLEDLGVTYDQSSQWQKLAEVPATKFQDALDQAASEGVVSRSRVMSVHYSSETDMWSTPQALFDELDAEFGFTLDVCATKGNAKCRKFFTEADDGLAQEWRGTCWMNPPYGDAIVGWVRKAYESSLLGTVVVCLVPARVDTGWWWDYCRHGQIRFLRGRLKFGDGANSAPFPSAVVVFPHAPSVIWWER
jgi:phage N-6-adenine-methyltransferase